MADFLKVCGFWKAEDKPHYTGSIKIERLKQLIEEAGDAESLMLFLSKNKKREGKRDPDLSVSALPRRTRPSADNEHFKAKANAYLPDKLEEDDNPF